MTHIVITVVVLFSVGSCKLEPLKTTNTTSTSLKAENTTTAPRTGREHVPEPIKAPNSTFLEDPPKHNHFKSVPKKGVIQPPDSPAPNKTAKRTKPLITESDTDYIEANSSKETDQAVNEVQTGWSSSKIDRAKYVTPIVAVIMSVPFVAVVISLVYKRGADWWQHRNYKRMDFLVDGMYQN